jgi:hypothetical protein
VVQTSIDYHVQGTNIPAKKKVQIFPALLIHRQTCAKLASIKRMHDIVEQRRIAIPNKRLSI